MSRAILEIVCHIRPVNRSVKRSSPVRVLHLIETGGPLSLADKVLLLLDNLAYARKLGDAGRGRIEKSSRWKLWLLNIVNSTESF